MPKATPRSRASSVKLPPALGAIADSIIEARLPNGLRVRLVPNAGVPTCSYYTFFKVGARNERPGITGISHLFEHMMFNGAKKYGPGMFDKAIGAASSSIGRQVANEVGRAVFGGSSRSRSGGIGGQLVRGILGGLFGGRR